VLLDGHVDVVSRGWVKGWARDLRAPGRRVEVQVCDNGVVVGAIRADGLRADLVEAGIGDGCHSFAFAFPGGLLPGVRHVIEVRDAAGGRLPHGTAVFETA
jgi:hypothetical protein